MPKTRRESAPDEHGQILIVFALVMVVLIALSGLLYTGAQALVVRRQLQNAGDAAALAAANLLGVANGCSADGTTTPRSNISAAAVAAVAAVMPDYPTGSIAVTCPGGYSNSAVQVQLNKSTPAYFVGAIPVSASSTAFNGSIYTGAFAVALLDPSNPTWQSGGQRKGCASYTVNGGVSLTYEGSLVVDSACTLATSSNGAFKAINSGFSMTMVNGSSVMIFGQAAAGTASHITPAPIEGFRPALPDPLAGIVPPCHDVADPTLSSCIGTTGTNGTLPSRDMATTGQGICNGAGNKALDPCPIIPGTYTGGISVGGGSSPTTVLLRPGVYFIAGGGLSLKSGSARLVSIPAANDFCAKTTTNPLGVLCTDAAAEAAYATTLTDDQFGAQWKRDCPDPIANSTSSSCGVLIYNAKADSQSGWRTSGTSADAIANGAQGIILLRAYDSTTDSIVGNRTLFSSYSHLVMWQARLPAPDASNSQPDVSMAGGACVTLSGTVYAPGANVGFGGSTCGTGGGADAQLVLQFISWDLTLSGNNSFYFAYRRNAFATPTGYGLIK